MRIQVISERGVAGPCALEQLNYFKVATNLGFDPMHDLLEGVVQQILKLILKVYIKENKYFTTDVLNDRINNFAYGTVEVKDKPSSNFTLKKLSVTGNKIKQTAAQTWLLLRSFPFLLDGLIPNNHPLLDIVNILQRICYWSFSSMLTKKMVEEMDLNVQNLHVQFKKWFPHSSPINKMHHLAHYAHNVKATSVTNEFSCMRFEALNKLPKNQMKTAQNFKNVPYSLATRLNLKQVTAIANRDFFQRVDIISDAVVAKENMPDNELLEAFPANLCLVKHVKIDGIHFRNEVVIKYDDKTTDKQQFARIQNIYYVNDTFYFVVERLISICFEEKFNSFRVQPSAEHLLLVEDLVYKRKTYNLWDVSSTNDSFIALQYYDDFK